MSKERVLSIDERFDLLLTVTKRDGRRADLTAALGNPDTVGEARVIFRKLREFGGCGKLDRSVLELKYGDEIEW